MLEKAFERRIPIFGVCLGMQLLANYHAKSFVLDDVFSLNVHLHDLKDSYAHEITLNKNSKLFQVIGKQKLMVNSFHAKQIRENSHFSVAAFSSDGVIEAIEKKIILFALGCNGIQNI